MNAKVVGTTFHPLPKDMHIVVNRTWANVDGIPCAETTALLMAEPENPHDPTAIKVMVKVNDGSAFHLGYIGKEDPVKPTLFERFQTTPVIIVPLTIKDYGQVGQFNPSFMIGGI